MEFAKYYPVKSINWFIGYADDQYHCTKLALPEIEQIKAIVTEKLTPLAILADISNFTVALGSEQTSFGQSVDRYSLSHSTVVNFQMRDIDQSTVGAFLLQTIQPIDNAETPQARIDQTNHQIISLMSDNSADMVIDQLSSAFKQSEFDELTRVIHQVDKLAPDNQHACLFTQVNWEVA